MGICIESHYLKCAELGFHAGSEIVRSANLSLAASPGQMYHPAGLMMSANSVNANTTREYGPQARPRYAVAGPEPVTRQFTNE
jgi:hypothetical protein